MSESIEIRRYYHRLCTTTTNVRHVAREGARINIFVRLSNLKGREEFNLVCLMYVRAGSEWREVGRTETLANVVDSEFAKPIEVEYVFQEFRRVRFDVYAFDSSATSFTDEDHFGSVETTLGEIVTSSALTRPLRLNDAALEGLITLRAEDLRKEELTLQLAFSGRDLSRKDLLSRTDGYLLFSRLSRDGEWRPVLKTEVVKNSQNPVWRPLRVEASQLCGNDLDAVLRVECWDHDVFFKDHLIGVFETTVGELIRDGTGKEWPVINHAKAASRAAKNKAYEHSGIISLSSFQIIRGASFTDYLRAGLKIQAAIAIDFSGSNGRITSPESLHSIAGTRPNAYMKAIEAVVRVLQEYDSDKSIAAYGFGARIPPFKDLSHVFPLNFATGSPNCTGVQGVLDAYKATLSEIELHGPSNYSHIINHIGEFAKAIHLERSARRYHVLVILTDGLVSDLPETIREVVAASHLPISIIVVGIGGSDFSPLRVLDGDVEDHVAGVKSRRDIVQFVAYRNFESPAVLARELLAEIPRQVFEYYTLNEIHPGEGVVRLVEPHLVGSAEPEVRGEGLVADQIARIELAQAVPGEEIKPVEVAAAEAVAAAVAVAEAAQ